VEADKQLLIPGEQGWAESQGSRSQHRSTKFCLWVRGRNTGPL
jgi:hypothetical protein